MSSGFEMSMAEYDAALRTDFMLFVERAFMELNPQTDFLSAPHIEVMTSKMEDCRLGKVKRLIVNLPPRSLKSIVVSVAFTAWLLGNDPSAQIICVSYGQDLADKLARDCRSLMTSAFYRRLFPDTRLSPDKQSVHDFLTTAHGGRMATSVGGVLTGRGADYIILDDPLKPDDAMSETRRNGVNAWYDNSLLSRLNNKETGVIIIVMQRLHQDDLVGHVLEQGHWDLVSFPAIAVEDETHIIDSPFGQKSFVRRVGDVLHPERESATTLAAIKETLGSYNFESQYQQNPMPQGGSIFQSAWFQYCAPDTWPSRFTLTLQSWDTANKSGELNDYSVCTTWGARNDSFYLISVFRRRLNYPDLKHAVLQQSALYNPRYILIEDKASGTQLIQDLRAAGLIGIHGFEPLPGNDKIMRAAAQTASFEAGKVWFPTAATWLNEYLRELTTFPGSKFDDQVDSTTQALEFLTGKQAKLFTWARLGAG